MILSSVSLLANWDLIGCKFSIFLHLDQRRHLPYHTWPGLQREYSHTAVIFEILVLLR
jgi:hypothetical protein